MEKYIRINGIKMDNYIQPLMWIIIVLIVALSVCFIVNKQFNCVHAKDVMYNEKGYVRVSIRYPTQFTTSDVWVKEEDVN
jgi:hypothetical protein